ncbi:aspartic proteinase-like protein 2 isoform X2 [Sorghum bicolor]|uniref:aspartic proteinase-like protein 2 isoform X2 n=1 Tax=Sorghum bicolor TaxID=4558 RepID=UPI000B426558|nr:aspartic proteinase-like protein 2 isoform X2 [Sorghum bicolor]|eukprot:XP_021313607.1 aspartic proteinase-like protein 2 isoform X2 [Sorghum bicolor]
MAPPPPRLAALILLAALLLLLLAAGAAATGVFQVRRKFPAGVGGGASANISALRVHDGRRHGRLLAAADLPLGGLGLPTDTGLYFTEIKLGTPPKRYYVQVDTGSDILWVNCISCEKCPRKSGLGLDLTFYDPKASSSGSTVSCDQGFCAATYGGKLPGCTANVPCEYSVMYGDGSSTTGFFVTDALQFDQVTGDGQTQPGNATVTFGCGAQQGGDLGSSNQALDGILGFGQANTSMLSQLAAAGKVKKIFAHCLDTIKGGGIFAIGNVVQPKVKTTPLVADMPHYNVNLKSIDVGGTTLQLPAHVFETGERKGTIIDSGTTLTYLPELVFKEVMAAIFNKHQDIVFHNVQDFMCFQYPGRMTCTVWDSKMAHYNQKMERTLCLWETLYFQTSWLSMTWKIRSLGGLTTTVRRALKLRTTRQAHHTLSIHMTSPLDGNTTGTSPWFCCW